MLARSFAKSAQSVKGLNQVAQRSFRATASKRGGDDEHHDHPMFENLPFNKGSMGLMCGGAVVGGVSLVWFSCSFQNKKHGFTK